MKKILSVFLAAVIAAGALFAVPSVFAEDNTLKFATATDIHSKEIEESIPVNFPENELYFHAANTGNLYNEAIGILETFLSGAAEEGAEFILLTGDMTNSGTIEQHEYFASVIGEFEDNTGIQVYATPGNHDYSNSKPDDYKRIYEKFGFDEAIAVDDVTASYVVDLPDGYRLIAIDSNNPGSSGDGIDERLLSWIAAQAEKGHADGKKLIAAMHHSLLEPIAFAPILMGDFIVRDYKDIAEQFTQWGIQYVFTGHEHGNNVSRFVGSNGSTVYNILTTALTSYPLNYRMVTFDDEKVDIKCESVTECNFDYLIGGYTDAQLDLMEKDYTEYSYGYFRYSIEKKIAKYITPEFIKDKLNADSGALADALDAVMPIVERALQMPLYKADTDGESVEALANAASATLPASDFYNLYDLVTAAVAAHYYGNENLSYDEVGKVLIVALNTMLKYILAEAGNEVTTLALNKVVEAIGFNKLNKVDLFRWNRALVAGADNSYEVAFAVLEPLLNQFLQDDELPDRDVTLPAIGEKVEKESFISRFIEKLKFFFEYIFKVVFAVLKF